MVQNSRAAPRAGAIKPLNAPAPVQVRTDDTGRPVAVRLPVLAATRPGRSLPARPAGRQQHERPAAPGGSKPALLRREPPAGPERRAGPVDGRRPEPVEKRSHGPIGERRHGPGEGRRQSDGLTPWQAVAAVDDGWKVIDEWWRGADQQIARMYYSVVLENGQRTTLFNDFARNAWFRQAS